MSLKKTYQLTETGKAEVLSITTCPICGAARDSNLDRWDYVSNCWNKSPLTCGHGYWITENMNTTDDAANDDWQDSVIIKPEYIPELEALGYSEALKPEPAPPIYMLPCTYTGLGAEIDNCDPPADVIRVDASAPQAYGYTRYLLLSGEIVDINIDQFDFADWFEVSELVEMESTS